MILDLRSVFANGDESLTYNTLIDLTEIDIRGFYPFKKFVNLACEIKNHSGIVQLIGLADFEYHSQCDRCAIELIKQMTIPINHILVTEVNNNENEEFIVIKDMQLDITELTISDILLLLPSKFLCDDDCKGICEICGNNLNEIQCNCKKSIDPRLEALKKFLN